MNFQQISYGKALRVAVNGKPITPRKKYEEIIQSGQTPESYVQSVLSQLGIGKCSVEYFKANGTSFIKEGQFDYSNNGSATTPAPITHGVPLGGAFQGLVYTGHEALLAKQYEKWYNEEADKNRKLRNELDEATRELNRVKNDLQLADMKKEVELQKRELDMEKASKTGLDGFADTIEKNPYLQTLLDKIVDSFNSGGKTNGIETVNDPEIQKAITDATHQLVQMATNDREHFAYVALALDKLTQDKEMAKYIYNWMNTPTEGTQQSTVNSPPL
jgi:hypothetical protein